MLSFYIGRFFERLSQYFIQLMRRLVHGIKKIFQLLFPGTYQALKELRHSKRCVKESSNLFIPYEKNKTIQPIVTPIAFYLPSKNHHSLDANTIEKDAKLARSYGIGGFSYYFGWVNEGMLMEDSLQTMLNNKAIDMPFCLTWANDNFVKSGSTNNQRILSEPFDEAAALFQHLMPYFKDERYIRVDGKPVFIVCDTKRVLNIPHCTDVWREEIKKAGLPGIYLIAGRFCNASGLEEIGFDAMLEFPTYTFNRTPAANAQAIDQKVSDIAEDYRAMVQESVRKEELNYPFFRSVTISWDNPVADSANAKILSYKRWLSYAIDKVYKNSSYTEDKKLIFIHSWEHLQPCEKLGYSYLHHTYDVLQNYDKEALSHLNDKKPQKKNEYAVVLHLFFEQLWPEICSYLAHLNEIGFDLYVSVTSTTIGLKVKQTFPDAYIHLVENRGRDILPFIEMLPIIESMDYTAVCKIHSKYTMQYVRLGKMVRRALFNGLLGSPRKIDYITTQFNKDASLGMVVPKSRLLNIDKYMFPNELHFNSLCQFLELNSDKGYIFPAGSMFWFRPPALTSIKKIKESFFELESGATDGKIEHAVERIFCLMVRSQGYKVSAC